MTVVRRWDDVARAHEERQNSDGCVDIEIADATVQLVFRKDGRFLVRGWVDRSTDEVGYGRQVISVSGLIHAERPVIDSSSVYPREVDR